MREANGRIRVTDGMHIVARGKKKIYSADYWSDGRHCRRSLGTSNRKVAEERAVQLAADLARGTLRQIPKPLGIREAGEQYAKSLISDGRARRTLVKYAGAINGLATFLEPQRVTKIGQLTPAHIDAWRAARLETMDPATVYNQAVTVMQLSKWAANRKLTLDNPLAGMKLHRPPKKHKPSPSSAQVEALLAAAAPPLRCQLTILALTGMRVGELQRLRADDVDLAGGWIHIRSRPGAATKTGQSRKVPIHPRLRAALESLPTPASGWYFTAAKCSRYPSGDHWINPNGVNDGFILLLKNLGMPAGRKSGYVTHSLRHFFETFTVNAGIPQRVIDTWLGHNADKSMAAVYYALGDAESQAFMLRVPFRTGPAAPGTEMHPRSATASESRRTRTEQCGREDARL